ncbi:hypothetical protein BC828DRAFT_299862 [Blastocladiella britannica]|nr:hypothetical protein BC828DRAFT_299862 [Blastocladiella britannica]
MAASGRNDGSRVERFKERVKHINVLLHRLSQRHKKMTLSCHECGHVLPSAATKYCPECGCRQFIPPPPTSALPVQVQQEQQQPQTQPQPHPNDEERGEMLLLLEDLITTNATVAPTLELYQLTYTSTSDAIAATASHPEPHLPVTASASAEEAAAISLGVPPPAPQAPPTATTQSQDQPSWGIVAPPSSNSTAPSMAPTAPMVAAAAAPYVPRIAPLPAAKSYIEQIGRPFPHATETSLIDQHYNMNPRYAAPLYRIFSAFDSDGDGWLTLADMKRMAVSTNDQLSVANPTAMQTVFNSLGVRYDPGSLAVEVAEYMRMRLTLAIMSPDITRQDAVMAYSTYARNPGVDPEDCKIMLALTREDYPPSVLRSAIRKGNPNPYMAMLKAVFGGSGRS